MSKGMKVDEAEALGELIESPGYPVFLRLLNTAAESIEKSVLSLAVSSDNERELFIRKSKAEGARQLISAFTQRVEKHRPRGA